MRIAVLGAGNIGCALIGGILKSHIAMPGDVVATTSGPAHAAAVSQRFAITARAGENLAAVEGADVIILAVKPHKVAQVLDEIRWGLRDDRILVSLAASYPMDAIRAVIGRNMPTFRAMPNIPVLVEEGATCIAHNGVGPEENRNAVARIFSAIGTVHFVPEEQLHAVTALSGSGPAYVYMVIEAMIAGGLKMGLSHEVSTGLAEQTVLGSAKLVKELGLHPAVLRDQVITPGGVTISAIHELERHGLRSTIISAIEIATRHSERLANKIQTEQPHD
jgi:pyrroline-5-carboxylate reductase